MSILSDLKPDIKNSIKWISIGILGIGISIFAWKVFDFVSDRIKVEKALVESRTNEKIAIENRDVLAKKIEDTNRKIKELEVSNEDLKLKVEGSKITIKEIQDKAQRKIDRLKAEKLPESCDQKFDWLLEKAIELKGEEDESK